MQTSGRWARHCATWFGLGYAPWAPGTVGSLAALPIHWALRLTPDWGPPVFIAFLCVVGAWASNSVARSTGSDDPQTVVVDEVAGTLIALAFVTGHGIWAELAALALFRGFDIFKPWPISAVEHCRPPGLGIMADDIVAGLVAGLLALLLVPLLL